MSRSGWKSVRKKSLFRCCISPVIDETNEADHSSKTLLTPVQETHTEGRSETDVLLEKRLHAANDSGIGLLDKQSLVEKLSAKDIELNEKQADDTVLEGIRVDLVDKQTDNMQQTASTDNAEINATDSTAEKLETKEDIQNLERQTDKASGDELSQYSRDKPTEEEQKGRNTDDAYFVRPYKGSKAIIMFTTDKLCFKEDLEKEPGRVYSKFMHAHRCYDLIPNSSKLVVFDTQLSVKKAFFALLYNSVRAAPLWDAKLQEFTGMLTISDFIVMLAKYYKSPNNEIEELEHQRISSWKGAAREPKPFIYTEPDQSLLEAVRLLLHHRVHRLPVLDAVTGNPLCILTHKRLLKFMYLYINDLPQPGYMFRSLRELGIGTYSNIATAKLDTPVITALRTFVNRRVSALPIVDDDFKVIDLYSKFDVINLAAEKSYNQLDIELREAMRSRNASYEVLTARPDDTLQDIVAKLAENQVHRLVLVDAERRVVGIVSLSDVLNYLVIQQHTDDSDGEPDMKPAVGPRARSHTTDGLGRNGVSERPDVDEVGISALDEQPMDTVG